MEFQMLMNACKKTVLLLAVMMLLTSIAMLAPPFAFASNRKPIPISEETPSLPLRVLTRPMSNLYSAPNESSGIVRGNLPTFFAYYVYTRPDRNERDKRRGWYEVGSDTNGTIVGWLKSADVFEWKQTMCLIYAHPGMRESVLMFDKEKYLTELIAKAPAARKTAVKGLYETIESGTIPKDFSVVSIEPKSFVDFTKQPYLLPILDHRVITIDGREGRMLQLAAAVIDSRKESGPFQPPSPSNPPNKELAFDIVWAIDTTLSMGPYTDATRDMVVAVSKQLANDEELSRRLRFGVWGYRDSIIEVPGLEYLTKNYTPTLQSIHDFGITMSTVKETKVNSGNFPEDMFSGISDAMEKTAWTPGAARILILVGDAPGHELGHRRNASGLYEITARALAIRNNITLMAIQIRPRGQERHQRVAEQQFKLLSLGPGMDAPAYYSIDGRNMKSFAEVTVTLVSSLRGLVHEAQQGNLHALAYSRGNLLKGPLDEEMAALLEMRDGAPQGAAQAIAAGNEGLNQALRAALVRWIGSQTEASLPNEVVAWVVDKDLMDATKPSLEVHLFINKLQLDALAKSLDKIIEAGRRGRMSSSDFFTSLQAVSATTSRDPDQLSNAQTLGESGLVPEFLAGLPYESRVMSMSNELWASLSPDEQERFLDELDSRMRAYRQIHDSSQGWAQLNEGADLNESVYPIVRCVGL
jgi:hypothetical protein